MSAQVRFAIAMVIGFLGVAAFSEGEKTDARPEPAKKKPRFAIHLVEKPESLGETQKTPLDELTLAEEPLITEDDVVTYVKELGEFVLRPGWRKRLTGDKRGPRPFVVSLKGKPWFLGAFWNSGISLAPPVPAVYPDGGLGVFHKPKLKDAIRIEQMPEPDQLRRTLMELGKYTAILPKEEDQRFAIYLVGEPEDPREALKKPPGQLVLRDEPVLTDEDIASYDWETHRITLREGRHLRLPERVVHEVFVVVAMGERCYAGAFISPISSWAAPGIPICNVDPLGLDTRRGKGGMKIRGDPRWPDDPRADVRIRKGLGPLVRETEEEEE